MIVKSSFIGAGPLSDLVSCSETSSDLILFPLARHFLRHSFEFNIEFNNFELVVGIRPEGESEFSGVVDGLPPLLYRNRHKRERPAETRGRPHRAPVGRFSIDRHVVGHSMLPSIYLYRIDGRTHSGSQQRCQR